MSRVAYAVMNGKCLAKAFGENVKEKVLNKRAGEAGVIVAAVLIVIAVVLLITFKGAITGWLTNINNNIATKIGEFTK